LLRLLEYQLGKNFDVRTAQSGEEALNMVREHTPDLIISDIMMPKMDGMELLSILKANLRTQNIPIIIISALYIEKLLSEARQMGVTDYVRKPFDVARLIDMIDRIIGKHVRPKSM